MDRFATLEPVRLHSSPAPSSSGSFGSRILNRNASKVPAPTVPYIGRLPVDLHFLVLSHLPVYEVSSYAQTCRNLNKLVKEDKVWEKKWKTLGIESCGLGEVLDDLEKAKLDKETAKLNQAPPVLPVAEQDDFGDFSAAPNLHLNGSAMMPDSDFGDFVGSPTSTNNKMPPPIRAPKPEAASSGFNLFAATTAPSNKHLYMRAHTLLRPLALSLSSSPPHQVLSTLDAFFASGSQTSSNNLNIRQTSKLLHLLALFLSPSIQPLRTWGSLKDTLRAAMDRFDANMLTAFDAADGRGDETGMKEAAAASWEVWEAQSDTRAVKDKGREAADWEMGKVWAEKREIFYEWSRWNALDNFTAENQLDFDAMDSFMTFVLKAIEEHGARAVRVFPPESQVIIFFAERIANEVLGEYITTLLEKARDVGAATSGEGGAPNTLFLQATAASFKEAWRVVDGIMAAATSGSDKGETQAVVQKTRAEDVVYQMFEAHMDEYLDEEVEAVKWALEGICKNWDRELTSSGITPTVTTSFSTSTSSSSNTPADGSSSHLPSHTQPRFLSSQNPAQVKRTVLASFTSVLLLPVTIVPRTVGAVGAAVVGGTKTAAEGIGAGLGMLNPAKWGGTPGQREEQGEVERVSKTGWGVGYNPAYANHNTNETTASGNGKVYGGGNGMIPGDENVVFEVGGEEEEEDEEEEEVGEEKPTVDDPWAADGQEKAKNDNGSRPLSVSTTPSVNSVSTAQTATAVDASSVVSPALPTSGSTASTAINKLELMLSLDVALEMIHSDRDSLKRVETFAGYPGHYGHRVRDTIEEIFVLMLERLGDGHLRKGFGTATQEMHNYKPAEHDLTTSVAPLMQFFELVHIGDTIQSMVQVYFDKELAQYIDRTDFLNAVVREKKRFENALDDSVAAGLNAGTEVLMNQVEHIILTLTKPREYYPPEDGPLELGPTKGCTEAIKCLEMHCKLLKGSTSKEVLEVFYQEVGIRLIAILQKHIKRQIISLNGGFQVIADLNTYHNFIASLKVPSITSDFAHLKMLGHVYVVEDAKDLAQIVRDVTRYGGAYRPEDIYEFIQRRSDWKKIEKTVDKTMYNLSFKEDCIVC